MTAQNDLRRDLILFMVILVLGVIYMQNGGAKLIFAGIIILPILAFILTGVLNDGAK